MKSIFIKVRDNPSHRPKILLTRPLSDAIMMLRHKQQHVTSPRDQTMKSRSMLSILLLLDAVWRIDAFVTSRRVRPRPALQQQAAAAIYATKKESVAVVGSGAVGCYYGARLWESDAYDVSFHMRGEHYAKSVEGGLNVTSIDGDIMIPADKLKAYEHTSEMGTADWVVVCLKSSSLDAIPELIAPLLHKGTRLLVIMNGLVEDDLLAAMNKDAKSRGKESVLDEFAALYGGMALICSNRLGPGRVDHSYAGLLSGGVAVSRMTPEEDREAFMNLWKPTTVKVTYEESLLRGRWRKCIWNLPFNGISVAMGGITVDVIVNDPGLRRLADIVMDETVAAANADLSSHGVDSSQYLGDADVRFDTTTFSW